MGIKSLHELLFRMGLLDMDAIVYLMLANTLVHRLGKVITIAEDVSGYVKKFLIVVFMGNNPIQKNLSLINFIIYY